MKTFGFYSKNSKTEEIIAKTKSQSKEEAIEYFSYLKKLPVKDFLNLFKIKEVNDKSI